MDFAVGKLFHLAHLVEDLDAVDRWYDDIFACERFYRKFEKAAQREASLLVISDMLMEPIMPSAAPEAAGTPLRKFRDRFGNRLHSIAWYVDDIRACSAHLAAHGIRQVGLTGKPVTDPTKAVAVWTHPRDTRALWEFCEPGFAADPRLEPGWSARRWRDEHPLRIERTAYLTVLFEDVEDAAALYGDALGGRLLHREEEPGERRSAFYAVGEETVIEAQQPLRSTSAAGRDLAANGEGVHALVFASADLTGAASFLEGAGQRLTGRTTDTFWIDPRDSFGLTVGFTSRRIPGDGRGGPDTA
jgi:catechol 2,3-dioxygenase-like lactoylglutathione lyase family enzyme